MRLLQCDARAVFRLLGGFAGAPPTAVFVALVTYDALWYCGLLSGGAPIDSIDAAGSLGLGVGILAIVMTICSAPLVAWLNRRRTLSLRNVLLLGAVLGNMPFAIIVLGVVLAHPMSETLSGDIGRSGTGSREPCSGLRSALPAARLPPLYSGWWESVAH